MAEPVKRSSELPTLSAPGHGDSSKTVEHLSPPVEGRFPPGTILAGRFRMVSVVGRGGMGEVYRADDLKLGRPVALKLLPEALEKDRELQARLLQEVNVAREITHPNVCRVHDVGETDGHLFISMEFIDGEDLASLLRRIGRLPQDKAIEIGLEICSGLVAAHELGILHRDLKPANLMIDERGRTLITDFGLAGLAQRGLEARSGTPAYMAPEQSSGEEVSVQSDLYALGLVLYELFTGQQAFEGASQAEVVRWHREVTPRPPSSLWQGLAPGIEEIILRCLEKHPHERPESTREVAAALKRGGEVAIGGVAIRTLLLSDLVASTRLTEESGDAAAAEIFRRHDRLVRDLLTEHHGLEIDKTDGFLLLFERPWDAVRYALSYHRALAELAGREGVELTARVGIHLGELIQRRNPPQDIARGAKPLEVEGLAKPTTARLMSLAGSRQTLLSRGAFDLARRGAVGEAATKGLCWLAHGRYLLKGMDDPIEVFEVGVRGFAPLAVPPDSEKARRSVPEGDEITLGWRPATELEIPLRPNWTLGERLGEGGFGEVWLASHRKTGEKRVFKFCYEAQPLRSLQREATLFRLLKETLGQRDDIARILDWNFDEAPYFLESEYTEGGNLVEWIEGRGGPDTVPLATRLEIIAQVAEALAAAHSVGVLHKDVKPGNVLMSPERDGVPKARLTDFGIGRVLDEDLLVARGITVMGLTEQPSPTGTSSPGGTHNYLAPELLEGEVATVQADIYALGVMLYQAVVGNFSHALAPGWRRDVPDPILAGDIARMVDGAPERRLSSASEVADRLRRLEERRAEVEARQARERTQRRLKLTASFGTAAIGVLVIVSILAIQATQARREADLRRGQAEDLIGFMLGHMDKLEAAGRLDILKNVGDKALEYFAAVPEKDLTDRDLFRRSEALMKIGSVRIAEGNLDSAMAAFQESVKIDEQLIRADPDNSEWLGGLADRHFWVARVLWDRGDRESAIASWRSQLAIGQRLVETDPDNPEFQRRLAYATSNIGWGEEKRGNLKEALVAYRSGLEIKQMLVDREPENPKRQRDLANQYNLLGPVFFQLGELDAAREHLDTYYEISQAMSAGDPENAIWKRHLAISHNFLGRLHEATGNPYAARTNFQEALAITEALVGADATRVDWQAYLAIAHRRLGSNLKTLNELERAFQHVEEGLGIMVEIIAKNPANTQWHLDLAAGHVSVGQVQEAQGNIEDARRQAQEAIAILEPVINEAPQERRAHRELSEAYLLLGRALNAEGNIEEGRPMCRRAIDVVAPFARDSKDIAFLSPWVEALLFLDREKEAEPILQKIRDLGYHPYYL